MPLLPWLTRLCGKRVVERLWKPLLDSKFDGALRRPAGDLHLGAARSGCRRRATPVGPARSWAGSRAATRR